MSQSRLNLQTLLETITDRVYYQKPSKITVPCIVYEKSNYATKYADNKIYSKLTHYVVTYITDDPDDEEITDKILYLPYCSFDRRFISNNLYHDVFDLYYENNTTLEDINKEEK